MNALTWRAMMEVLRLVEFAVARLQCLYKPTSSTIDDPIRSSMVELSNHANRLELAISRHLEEAKIELGSKEA